VAGNDKAEAGSFEYTRTRHRRLGYIGKHNECIPLISRSLAPLGESITYLKQSVHKLIDKNAQEKT